MGEQQCQSHRITKPWEQADQRDGEERLQGAVKGASRGMGCRGSTLRVIFGCSESVRNPGAPIVRVPSIMFFWVPHSPLLGPGSKQCSWGPPVGTRGHRSHVRWHRAVGIAPLYGWVGVEAGCMEGLSPSVKAMIEPTQEAGVLCALGIPGGGTPPHPPTPHSIRETMNLRTVQGYTGAVADYLTPTFVTLTTLHRTLGFGKHSHGNLGTDSSFKLFSNLPCCHSSLGTQGLARCLAPVGRFHSFPQMGPSHFPRQHFAIALGPCLDVSAPASLPGVRSVPLRCIPSLDTHPSC